jgi:hypothetical protein
MGRKKGGGGRSYNAPVMYEPSTVVHGTSVGTHGAIAEAEGDSSYLSIDTTSSSGAEIAVGGGLPQRIECDDTEQIELWLAALRDFLARLEQQGTAFCQAHQLAEEIAAQLAQAIVGLLTTDRGQLKPSELSPVYQCVQQILLTTQALTGEAG